MLQPFSAKQRNHCQEYQKKKHWHVLAYTNSIEFNPIVHKSDSTLVNQ